MNKIIKQILELVKYGFWGGISTVLNIFLYFILSRIGVYYLVANIISYFIAVIFNFFLNKKFVFTQSFTSENGNDTKLNEKSKSDKKQFIQFIMIRLVSLVVENILLYILVSIIGWPDIYCKLGLSAFTILATYFINKNIVFKNSVNKNEDTSL